MTVVSTLLSGTEILASWAGNDSVAGYFASYAEAFECKGDTIELPVTRQMVDQMIREIEDFLTGVDFESSVRWMEPLREDDVVLVYREEMAF